MTLKKIQSIARGLLTAPGRILRATRNATAKTLKALKATPKTTARGAAAICFFVAHAIDRQNPQGEFHLPQVVRPFFFPTLWVVIFSGIPFLYFWLEASIKQGDSFLEIAESGAKIAPAYLAASIAIALFLTLPAYLIFGGIAMLGPIFRRWADKNSIEARDRTIEQQAKQLQDKDHTIQELRQRLTDHGVDPDATDG